MGTARMATDPAKAPGLDGSPRHRGLYVADGSLFPTSIGVNPMMTIIAFSKQVARAVAGESRPQPQTSSLLSLHSAVAAVGDAEGGGEGEEDRKVQGGFHRDATEGAELGPDEDA